MTTWAGAAPRGEPGELGDCRIAAVVLARRGNPILEPPLCIDGDEPGCPGSPGPGDIECNRTRTSVAGQEARRVVKGGINEALLAQDRRQSLRAAVAPVVITRDEECAGSADTDGSNLSQQAPLRFGSVGSRRVGHAGLIDVVAEKNDGRALGSERGPLAQRSQHRLALERYAGIADEDDPLRQLRRFELQVHGGAKIRTIVRSRMAATDSRKCKRDTESCCRAAEPLANQPPVSR